MSALLDITFGRPIIATVNPPSRRIWIFLVLLLVCTAGAALLDRPIAEWVHDHPLYEKGSAVVRLLKVPGTYPVALLAAALLAIFHSRRWMAAGPLILSGPLVGLLYTLLKWLVGRHRPDKQILPFDLHPFSNGLRGLIQAEKDLGFPSGHAAMAFATATCLTAALPRLWPLFFTVAAAVAAERVLENAHYLSDVVAGAGLGIFCGVVSVMLLNRRVAVRDLPEVSLAQRDS